MSLNYSFTARYVKPGDADSAKKVYAIAQSKETVTLRHIAAHIAEHNSVFSEGTVLGLLVDAVKCMTENLMQGNRIDMWDLGTFFVTLSGQGADSAEDFSTSLIKEVNLRWMTSEKMHKALQGIDFNRIATRELQENALKQMIEIVNQSVGVTDDSGDGGNQGGSGSEGGNSGGGGGNDDNAEGQTE